MEAWGERQGVSHQVFAPAVEPPEGHEPCWWFIFRAGELLVVGDAPPIDALGWGVAPPGAEPTAAVEVPLLRDPSEIGLCPVRRQYLGRLTAPEGETRGCWSAEVEAGVEPPEGMSFGGLRVLHGALSAPFYAVAGRAAQIVAWDRDHQFCGRCGTPTEPLPTERARKCPDCGLANFPRLSPAVIVLIERDDRILLARGRQFPPGRWGIIAGFVEPGESLEYAVRREVREEVGIELTDVRYAASQPWPFPHAIMLGFTARWASGEIQLDERELAEAGWFGIDELPRIPMKLSIARALIDAWAERQGRTIEQ